MAEPVTLRPLFGKVLALVVAVIIVGCLVALGIQGDMQATLRYSAPLVACGYLVWISFWMPAVEVGRHGVRLLNVFRTITVPWSQILRIDTKYALTLSTPSGKYVAWAATAGSRHRMFDISRARIKYTKQLPPSTFVDGTLGLGDLPDSDSGDAATIVRRHWDALRSEDALQPAATGPAPVVRWNPVSNSVFAALVVLSTLSLAFV